MGPATIERLKADWTGRRVAVASTAPALRRFAGQTGRVVTVNMNGQALVRFDFAADVGWYDIDLSELEVMPEPPPRCDTTSRSEHHRSTTERIPVTKIVPDAPAGSRVPLTTKAILELARKQGPARQT